MNPVMAQQSRREKALADPATVLRPAAAAVAMRLPLSPQEAYLYSRIERPTPVGDVLLASGLPAEQTLPLLLSLLQKGALLLPGESERPAPPPPAASPYGRFAFDRAALEEDVDLDLERRKEILFLFQRLGALSHYRLLGITPLASPAEMKKAFLERSRRFHPDVFLGRRLGSYQMRIERIFQRLSMACDTLLDEPSRRAYDRDNADSFMPEEQKALVQLEIERLEDEKRQRERRGRMLRAKGFGRLTRAREALADGDARLAAGDVLNAEAAYTLAGELDPRMEEARSRLAGVHRVALALRTAAVQQQAENARQEGKHDHAASLLEGVLEQDRANRPLRLMLGRVLLEGGRATDALPHVQRAIELGEGSAGARLLLGEIFLALDMKKDARRELQAAVDAGETSALDLLARV